MSSSGRLITSADITDLTIVDADVATAAAIALAKLAPGASGVLLSNGTAISAGNTVASGNIAAHAVTNATYSEAESSVTTTSTTFSNVSTLSVPKTAGTDLLVIATIGVYIATGTPTRFAMGLRLDSGTDLELGSVTPTGAALQLTGVRLFTGVAATNPTVALRGLMAGTGSVESYWRSILALELLR